MSIDSICYVISRDNLVCCHLEQKKIANRLKLAALHITWQYISKTIYTLKNPLCMKLVFKVNKHICHLGEQWKFLQHFFHAAVNKLCENMKRMNMRGTSHTNLRLQQRRIYHMLSAKRLFVSQWLAYLMHESFSAPRRILNFCQTSKLCGSHS